MSIYDVEAKIDPASDPSKFFSHPGEYDENVFLSAKNLSNDDSANFKKHISLNYKSKIFAVNYFVA